MVKHPLLAIHIYGLMIGLAGAAAGLSRNGIVWLGVAAGIPYAMITTRWEEAAARNRTARNTAGSANAIPHGHTATPIHPD